MDASRPAGGDLEDGTHPEPRAPAPSRPLPGRATDPSDDTYEAALRAADALFSSRPQAPATTPGETDSAGEPGAANHPAGGRVLRVLDEAPSADVLRLEAERAPKRRGRKPGSKNKPKPVASIVAEEAALEPFATAPFVAPPFVAPQLVAPPIVALERAARPKRVVVSPDPERAVAAGDRFAWVRTKLKPGQQWKRRLPKVAW